MIVTACKVLKIYRNTKKINVVFNENTTITYLLSQCNAYVFFIFT